MHIVALHIVALRAAGSRAVVVALQPEAEVALSAGMEPAAVAVAMQQLEYILPVHHAIPEQPPVQWLPSARHPRRHL